MSSARRELDGSATFECAGEQVNTVLRALVDAGVSELRTERPSLEDVYLELTADEESAALTPEAVES